MTITKAIDVSTFGTEPWNTLTPNVRYGDLSGILDLSSESGLAAGVDLDDVTEPNIVATQDRVRIQLRGQAAGCLTFDAGAKTGFSAEHENELDLHVNGALRLTANEEGLLFYDVVSGTVNKVIRWSGDTYSTAADIHGTSILGLSATMSVVVLLDTDNNTSTSGAFQVACDAENALDATALFYVREDQRMGTRLDGLSHAATSLVAQTDTYFEVTYDRADSALPGGAVVTGIKDDQVTAGEEGGALILQGLLEEDVEVGINSTSRALVEIRGAQLSGGSLANVVSNGLVLAVKGYVGGAWTNCIMVDEDGDLYYRGTYSDFDEEDDVQLAGDLYAALRGQAGTRYTRRRLAQMRLLNESGEIYSSAKGLGAVALGAIREIGERQTQFLVAANTFYTRLNDLDERVRQLEAG